MNAVLGDIISRIDAYIELDILHPIFLKKVLDEIPLERNSRVIDIGCGAGWACRHIAGASAEREIVGIDISEKAIRAARGTTPRDLDNIEYIVADAKHIPFPDGYFDSAIAFVSFSWWEKPYAILKEIKRILKDGGELYVLDIYDRGFGSVFTRISNCFLSRKERIYAAEGYRKMMGRVFPDIRQRKVSPLGWGLLTVGIKGAFQGK